MKRYHADDTEVFIVGMLAGAVLGTLLAGLLLWLIMGGTPKSLSDSLVKTVAHIHCGDETGSGWVVSTKPRLYDLPKICVQPCLDWVPTTDLARPQTIAYDGTTCEIRRQCNTTTTNPTSTTMHSSEPHFAIAMMLCRSGGYRGRVFLFIEMY